MAAARAELSISWNLLHRSGCESFSAELISKLYNTLTTATLPVLVKYPLSGVIQGPETVYRIVEDVLWYT